MAFPKLTDAEMIERLQPPTGKVRIVLDTDTYNEVDDQFAVAHALLSPDQMSVEALYAAPFYNGRSDGPADGMERSYDEILRLLDRLNVAVWQWRRDKARLRLVPPDCRHIPGSPPTLRHNRHQYKAGP